MAVHKRHKHPEAKNTGSMPPLPPKNRIVCFLDRAKKELSDRYKRLEIIAQLVLLGCGIASLMAGVWFMQGTAPDLPFLPLSMFLGFLIFIMRKDLGFNLKFQFLKLLRKNPRIIYHVDGSKAVTRTVVSYDPRKGLIHLGSGKNQLEIEIMPPSVLYDADRNVPGGLHVGGERHLINLFEESGDYWTAKQVDIMLKDAEQLGELKSNERLDRMLQILYIIGGAAAISAVVGIIVLTSVGELNASVAALTTQLDGLPALMQNLLGGLK